MQVLELVKGSSPILISIPHDGDHIPSGIKKHMHEYAHTTPDRDLNIHSVFNVNNLEQHSFLKANISRYVVDLNRSPDNTALYSGQSETELCPTTQFNFKPIYLDHYELSEQETQQRVALYWQPYHQELARQINRIKQLHGYCILIDAHSIKAEVPRFFDGTLKDINVGTNGGKSCAPWITDLVKSSLHQQSNFSFVFDGRFKGGYITRHYGKPENKEYSLQFEISQAAYLSENELNNRSVKLVELMRSIIQNLSKAHQKKANQPHP